VYQAYRVYRISDDFVAERRLRQLLQVRGWWIATDLPAINSDLYSAICSKAPQPVPCRPFYTAT
jgi:hypothetical protein